MKLKHKIIFKTGGFKAIIHFGEDENCYYLQYRDQRVAVKKDSLTGFIHSLLFLNEGKTITFQLVDDLSVETASKR